MEVARCEVTQLAQSRQYPTIAGIIKPFVPKNVYERYLVYYIIIIIILLLLLLKSAK